MNPERNTRQIRINKDTHQLFKLFACKEGRTICDLATEIVRDFLQENKVEGSNE
jgi:hypothetical protein